MSWSILVAGFGLFIGIFIGHVLIWRLKRPKNDVAVLFFLFLLVPIPVVLAFQVFMPVIDLMLAYILHFALAAAYIASYPAAQAHSPSLDILYYIGSSSRGKLCEDEIISRYQMMGLVADRIEDLKIGGMVEEHNGSFTLRPLSMIILKFYIIYRKCLGLEFGEG